MEMTSSMQIADSPHFYFVLGVLVSTTVQDHFALNMIKLIAKLLPVTALTLSEWTLDNSNNSLIDIKPLGTAGNPADIPVQQANSATANPPLLKEVQEMEGSLLIRLNTRTKVAAGKASRVAAHECTLVARDGSRRCLV
ncbi:helix-turn-helix transcriptional regulator, partial [Pseudomonas sp. MWU12-2115]